MFFFVIKKKNALNLLPNIKLLQIMIYREIWFLRFYFREEIHNKFWFVSHDFLVIWKYFFELKNDIKFLIYVL